MNAELPLLYLETGEMLAVTGAWLSADRATCESIPVVQALLPAVEKAHASLQQAAPHDHTSRTPGAAYESIATAEKVVDVRHDHALRALFYGCEANAEYYLSLDPPDVERAEAVLALRDRLLPDGLSGTQASFEAEVGNAARANELGSAPESRQLLGDVHVNGAVNGNELLIQYATLGVVLGELGRQKRDALKAAGEEMPPLLGHARNEWISIVGTLLAALRHVQGQREAVEQIAREVTDLSIRAVRRHAAQRKAKKADKPGAGESGGSAAAG